MSDVVYSFLYTQNNWIS